MALTGDLPGPGSLTRPLPWPRLNPLSIKYSLRVRGRLHLASLTRLAAPRLLGRCKSAHKVLILKPFPLRSSRVILVLKRVYSLRSLIPNEYHTTNGSWGYSNFVIYKRNTCILPILCEDQIDDDLNRWGST